MLDPDRTLALTYVPARLRPAVSALWRLDVALGAVLTTGREPMVRQIRLAWWREALERLDHTPAPAEPLLRDLERHVLPLGIKGARLAGLEEGWRALLADEIAPYLEIYGAARGGLMFSLTAEVLGDMVEGLGTSGEVWALADFVRHSSKEEERYLAHAAMQARLAQLPPAWPAKLRPLGMLARLARRDATGGWPSEPQGAPRRMLAMALHRFTGR